MVWTLVEPGVAITAACLVTMRPLLRCFNLKGFESRSAAPHTPLTLRNDISGGHWSTISSHGGKLEHKRSFSLTALERLNGLNRPETRGERGEILNLDSDLYGSWEESGITKTVDVRVEHGRASQISSIADRLP